MATFSDLFACLDPDPRVRGKQFERICRWFLTNDPVYKHELRRVWLWDEWPPGPGGRWGIDAGIDLVAEETVQELARLDRPPLTTPLVVQLLDPTDHYEIARAFSGALREINRELGLLKNQLWVLLNTGTPQMQSVWLLLANMGLVVARFSQSSPGALAAQSGTPPVREFIADLSHWRELFDFGGTAKPRARPSGAALIARRASHG